MRRVKLPPELGGAVVQAYEDYGYQVHGVAAAVVDIPGVGWCAVPTAKLSEAPPEEPPPGLWVLRHEDGFESLAQRVEPHGWIVAGYKGWQSWEWVVQTFGAITAVLPVFVAPEPVKLPWFLSSINGWGCGGVRLASDNPAAPIGYSIEDRTRFLSTAQAREMAGALLAAADQAEKGQPNEGA